MNAPIRRGRFDRRAFLHQTSALGVASLLGVHRLAHAEPPPETKRIRLPRFAVDVACIAPGWAAEDLLRAEGFDEVQYVEMPPLNSPARLAAGDVDITLDNVFGLLAELDDGVPMVAIGGVHSGCYELFTAGGLRTIRDLKGKTIAVANRGRQKFMGILLAHVGLDPQKDSSILLRPAPECIQLFAAGKADAILGFGAEPNLLREMKVGDSIVNTRIDRPWAQYLCCTYIGNRDFIARHPIATRRALRALLKANDICAAEPERTARTLVERGFLKDYERAAQVLRETPYRNWREYSLADTMRFYALRLRDAGLIKSNPQALISQGSDLRFFEQLKKELKA